MAENRLDNITEENQYIVRLKKPYMFEGTEYKEIDLSGLEELTTMDLKLADKMYNATGTFALVKETDVTYCTIIAHLATKMPIEFFDNLPAHEGFMVKTRITGFLRNGE